MSSSDSSPYADLAMRPFTAQCAFIDERTASDRDISGLLLALGALRDHQPLAHAVCTLAVRGQLGREDIATALNRLFVTIGDTGIQRVLRALDDIAVSDEQLAVVADAVVHAIESLPLERLAALCLMDRWLKNHASGRRDAVVADAVEVIRRTLAVGAGDRVGVGAGSEVRDEVLLRAPGKHLAELGVADERLERFAGRVLQILEAAPKSLSQANAEEILARRVYTDPGHFLVELLQNAEDARAGRFAITIDQRAVTVWHDGVAFDAKDVVGVLSIGQTTKRKDQIGFFGVGFKSVYEICARPQIYSGPFCFEIADVSIPRPLARPADLRSGTRLVLELRDPGDPQRSPAVLHQRARAIPRETLLTLSSLREIAVRYAERSWCARAEAGAAPGRVRLVEQMTGGSGGRDGGAPDATGESLLTTEYLVESDHFAFTGGSRDAARVSATPVLVAIALDPRGVPVALDAGAPTVFSYLPTRERSGLGFLLHAHFDLPVDRERLDLDSPWNQWAISCAGTLLARAARRLAQGHSQSQSQSQSQSESPLDGLLDVIPLADEVAHPAYHAILAGLGRDAGDIAWLLAASGQRIAPPMSAILDDADLTHALAGVALDGQGRQALAPMTPRRQRVARSLGAVELGPADLVARIVTVLADAGEHHAAAPGEPGYWLIEHHDVVIGYLARAASRGAPAWLDALRALPVVLDDAGDLRRASDVVRASDSLRAVYGDVRRFVHARVDAAASGNPALDEFLTALGVERLGAAELIADLHDADTAAILAGARPGPLFRYLTTLPASPLEELGALPIVPASARDAAASDPAGGGARGDDPAASQRHRRLCPVGQSMAEDRAWLTPVGPVGEFVATMTGSRPPLVDPALAAEFGDTLRAMGARELDLERFLAETNTGAIALSPGDVLPFHGAVAGVRGDLPPRLTAALMRAAVFPDHRGTLRPLAGDQGGEHRALVPTRHDDHALIALLPEAPWIDPAISALPYLRTLGGPTLGAPDVAEALASGQYGASGDETRDAVPGDRAANPVRRFLDVADSARLRRVYAYLVRHAAEIPAALVRRLASSAIWLDRDGQRHALARLRLPARDPELAELYRAWGRFPRIEGQAPGEPTNSGDEPGQHGAVPGATVTAWHLASALGVIDRVIAPDHATLVDDLVACSDTAELAAIHAVLVRALARAATEVPRRRLVQLAAAAVFRADDGVLRPLLSWRDAVPGAAVTRGCSRATGRLRSALALGSRPLVAEADDRVLARLFDAMDQPAATVADLIVWVQRDPAFADHVAADAARRALVACRAELIEAVHDDTRGERLQALRELVIWPCDDGAMRPASAVVRRRDLHELVDGVVDGAEAGGADGTMAGGVDGLGDVVRQLRPSGGAGGESADPESEVLVAALGSAATGYAVLDPAADRDADALADVIAFGDPVAVTIALVEELAVVDAPLAEQAALLRDPVTVAALFCLAARQGSPWRLPLVVDGNGRLSRGQRYRASRDELAICRGLPLAGQLVDPVWAGRVARTLPDQLEPAGPRRVIAALAEVARQPGPIAEAEILSRPEQRQSLYRWLLEHCDEIARDTQARGALGRACVIATRGGYLRAPRQLLLDPAVPDLGIDWNAGDEVPDDLRRWLRAHIALDDKQLAPMVEQMLEAHEQAVRDRDGARSAELLGHLARCLRVDVQGDESAAAIVKRFKLRKRLRVEDSTGEFARPRTLLAPTPGRWHLVVRFAAPPPARVSARYDGDDAARQLIRLAGAEGDLGPEKLGPHLDRMVAESRLAGDAALALALYVAELASDTPALRARLGLERRAWIPSRDGVARRADQLYWPDGDAEAIVGDRPARFPHPRFFHGVPPDIAAWLRFRRADDAALADIAEHLDDRLARGDQVPDEILGWLERGLDEERLQAAEIRAVLGDRRWLRDDHGRLWTPDEVVREDTGSLFGRRRGIWSDARRYPRLAAALKIAKFPGKREIVGYLAEIAGDLEELDRQGERGAATLLGEEPDLVDRLPRCLALLHDAGGALPGRLPIAAESTAGDLALCLAPEPRGSEGLFRRVPEELVDAAIADQAPVLFALAPAGRDDAIDEILARLGVPDLAQAPKEVLPAVRRWQPQEPETSPRERPGREPDERSASYDRDEEHEGDESASSPGAEQPGRAERRRARRDHDRAERRRQRRDQRAGDPAAEDREDAASPPRDPRDDEDERDERDARDQEARERDESGRDRRGLMTRIRRWLASEPRRDDEDRDSEDRDDEKPDDKDEDRPRERQKRPRERRASDHRPPRPRSGARSPARPSAGRGEGGGDGGAPDHRQWFRPRRRLGPQMGDNTGWAADRQNAPDFGMAFAPHSLPWPYLYGVQAIFDRFEPGSQRWQSTALPGSWSEPRGQGRSRVAVRGRVPAGEVVVPVPAYARVETIRARSGDRLEDQLEGQLEDQNARGSRTAFFTQEDCDIEYHVVLEASPDFESAGASRDPVRDAPRHMLTATVSDDELPAEVLAAIDRIIDRSPRPLDRALAVREFIRDHYYYDAAYLEDPTLGRWLHSVSRGRANAHIAAMHAGRDARYLGRGVCYELNSLACELLRRVQIPAAVAVGWTFDRGHLDEPDHLWAMALLPTPMGPRWLPLDASTTRDGTPLHAGRRPPGPWRARSQRQNPKPPRAPSWARDTGRRHDRGAPESGPARPISDLVRVVRYVETLTGQRVADDSELTRRCRDLLGDPETAALVLRLVAEAESDHEPDRS